MLPCKNYYSLFTSGNARTLFLRCLVFFSFVSLVSCQYFDKRKTDKDSDFIRTPDRNEINVLTLSGSMSYFIYKGEPKGYEYELLRSFAESYHLKINIRLAENETKLTEMLLKGEGDLIAYTIPVTNEGREHLLYCGREVINEQVLIQRANRGDKVLKDVIDLIGKNVWVIHDSKYQRRLKNLNNELGGGIRIHTIDKDTVTVEDLIEMVARGEIPYTVSDAGMAKLNKTYFGNINISLLVGHPQRSSWAVRKTNPMLAEAINSWFADKRNNPQYTSIVKRYFEISKMPGDGPAPMISSSQISHFDPFFKEYAAQIPWDWRLLAAVSYQESQFLPDRVSWAGASGLMGLMPQTAREFDLPSSRLYDPERNIRAATGFIKRLDRALSSIEDGEERIKFILASYNSGLGHILDGQALAEKFGKDPNKWAEVEEYLKLKKLPEYYNDPVCKSGYLRGTETFSYVQNIMARWNYYKENVIGD